jgi:hypothetical protein
MENKISATIGIDAVLLQMMQTIQSLNNLESQDVKVEILQAEVEKAKTLNSLYATYANFAIAEVKFHNVCLERDTLATKGDFIEQIAKRKIQSNFFKSLE